MSETKITILASLVTIIVVAEIFFYFYNDLKKMIIEKEFTVKFSLLNNE